MLFAKDVVAVEEDFINVLDHIPGTKAEKQAYFQSRGIRVPRTNYNLMWEVLTERLHHSGAAQIVFECLQARSPKRLRELFRVAARGKAVELHVNEPAIVWDLFFQNGHLRRVGELFLEHRPAGNGRTAARAPAVTAPVHTNKPYELALSFAGEDRAFVESVAKDLRARGVRVFYDAFEQVDLLGKVLPPISPSSTKSGPTIARCSFRVTTCGRRGHSLNGSTHNREPLSKRENTYCLSALMIPRFPVYPPPSDI